MNNEHQIEMLKQAESLLASALKVTDEQSVPDDDGVTVLKNLKGFVGEAIAHFDESVGGKNLWRRFLNHAKQEVEYSAFWVEVPVLNLDCLFEIHQQTGHITVTADFRDVIAPASYRDASEDILTGLSQISGLELKPHLITANSYSLHLDDNPRLTVMLPRRIKDD